MLGVVENMSGLRHRLGDFRFLRRSGAGGAEADVTAAVLQRIREVAPELEVSALCAVTTNLAYGRMPAATATEQCECLADKESCSRADMDNPARGVR